jgi:hypothetical protein
MNRCKELYDEDPTKAPTIIFIKEGEHEVQGYEDEYKDEYGETQHEHLPYLLIQYAMKIIGAGRDKTFLTNGGFMITGTKEEGKNVALKEMTLQEASDSGIFAENGLSFLCKDMTFTQCGSDGVQASNTKGRLINCVITQCAGSGIVCISNALIELEGDQTKVDGNNTDVDGNSFGLETIYTSSKIHLLFPLTKESVSTNNGGLGNYGGSGTIKTVTAFEL